MLRFESKSFGRQPSPSAAQRCNGDVQEAVFSRLDRITLANVVRVCRGWQPVATSKLYYDILILAWEPAARKLADTLMARPGLRGLVRRVTLNHTLPKQWVSR